MDRFTAYLKGQLKELVTDYQPGILWFDGEWEAAWTHERGVDLYDWLRDLDPALIINNRVDKGRKGMEGHTTDPKFKGDYGTPEQEIPATGFGEGVSWESCMTMNGTWGFKTSDTKWKSTEVLVRNLIDIASKGGNYLLNVGPTGEGEIPAASLERLAAIGEWMKVNGESIHGTTASLFPAVSWDGRSTTRKLPDGKTRVYLQLFSLPADGKIALSGLDKPPAGPRHPRPVRKARGLRQGRRMGDAALGLQARPDRHGGRFHHRGRTRRQGTGTDKGRSLKTKNPRPGRPDRG